MVVYRITVRNTTDQQDYNYSLDLSQEQENNPHLIFNREIKSSMQKQLEKQTLSKISLSQIESIINFWLQDIREGYRDTRISLKLKSTLEENLQQLQDDGYQEIPQIVDPDFKESDMIQGMLPPLERIILG